MENDRRRYYRQALWLARITVGYNILEGIISIHFGWSDETLALFGFGLDSFVEVLSGIGVWHMVSRFLNDPDPQPDRFEQRALRITGVAFYLLAAGLVLTAILQTLQGHQPETTFWGIVVATVSILTMWLLIHYKLKVGRTLNSAAILADAGCTRACLHLSVILLLSSIGYELTGLAGIDSIGSVLIAYFSLREGKESFEKARGLSCSCGDVC